MYQKSTSAIQTKISGIRIYNLKIYIAHNSLEKLTRKET